MTTAATAFKGVRGLISPMEYDTTPNPENQNGAVMKTETIPGSTLPEALRTKCGAR
jgi:hypothetical protein